MDAILNTNGSEQSAMQNTEKSELMQIFEFQVNDMLWAYKDLLKAIFEKDDVN